MEVTVREFTKIQAAAELIWSIAEAAGKGSRVFEVAASQILDELHVIRMREAGHMDEWAPGELTEGLDDGERWALKMLRNAKIKKNAETGRLPDVPDWRDTEAAKRELPGKTGNTKKTENRGNRSKDARSAGADGAARKARTSGHRGHRGRCGQGAGTGSAARDAGTDGAGRQTDDDLLAQCRLIVAAHQGESLAKMIEAVKAGAGISGSRLARLLGVNKARISEALNGTAKPYFIERFTEILGEGKED